MIGRLRGLLIEKHPPALLIEVGGVGYEVEAPMSTIYQLPALGQETVLYTHLTVRDDAHLLFGFASLHERSLFRLLIKVNGVGPKLALTILSGMAPDAFIQCLAQHDTSSLTRLPGVGKKTAERLVIELQESVKNIDLPYQNLGGQKTLPEMLSLDSNKQEAISAMVSLGYKPQIAARAIDKIYQADVPCETLIRQALQQLA